MPTNRTPINRPPVKSIPPEAVEIFKKMMACTDNCPECERLDDELRRVLRLKPWQGPTLIRPDEECVYPPGTGGAAWHPIGQALFTKLTELAKAAEAAEPELVS